MDILPTSRFVIIYHSKQMQLTVYQQRKWISEICANYKTSTHYTPRRQKGKKRYTSNSFLISTLDGLSGVTPQPRSTPCERTLGTKRLDDLRSSLDVEVWRKIVCLWSILLIMQQMLNPYRYSCHRFQALIFINNLSRSIMSRSYTILPLLPAWR
jgi:hypothetical protein